MILKLIFLNTQKFNIEYLKLFENSLSNWYKNLINMYFGSGDKKDYYYSNDETCNFYTKENYVRLNKLINIFIKPINFDDYNFLYLNVNYNGIKIEDYLEKVTKEYNILIEKENEEEKKREDERKEKQKKFEDETKKYEEQYKKIIDERKKYQDEKNKKQEEFNKRNKIVVDEYIKKASLSIEPNNIDRRNKIENLIKTIIKQSNLTYNSFEDISIMLKKEFNLITNFGRVQNGGRIFRSFTR